MNAIQPRYQTTSSDTYPGQLTSLVSYSKHSVFTKMYMTLTTSLVHYLTAEQLTPPLVEHRRRHTNGELAIVLKCDRSPQYTNSVRIKDFHRSIHVRIYLPKGNYIPIDIYVVKVDTPRLLGMEVLTDNHLKTDFGRKILCR